MSNLNLALTAEIASALNATEPAAVEGAFVTLRSSIGNPRIWGRFEAELIEQDGRVIRDLFNEARAALQVARSEMDDAIGSDADGYVQEVARLRAHYFRVYVGVCATVLYA